MTPGIYTRNQNFDEAAIVVNDLGSLDFAAIETFFRAAALDQ